MRTEPAMPVCAAMIVCSPISQLCPTWTCASIFVPRESGPMPSLRRFRTAITVNLLKDTISRYLGVERTPETALSIFSHLHTRLAPFKRIRKIELVTELPKTISGKIRRVQLRRLEHEDNREDSLRGVEFREEEFPELQRVRSLGSEN